MEVGVKVEDIKDDFWKKIAIDKFNEIDGIYCGQYLYGLSELTSHKNAVLLFVDDENFIFRDQTQIGGIFSDRKFREVGRIRRDAINQVLLEDRSTISQRLTVTRLLTLGLFSLAAPKRSKRVNLCLLIDWDDENGERQNTVFEFAQESWHEANAVMKSANSALESIKKYIKHKISILKPDEKKCPYCAEIIKKEAKLCRYCRSKVE